MTESFDHRGAGPVEISSRSYQQLACGTCGKNTKQVREAPGEAWRCTEHVPVSEKNCIASGPWCLRHSKPFAECVKVDKALGGETVHAVVESEPRIKTGEEFVEAGQLLNGVEYEKLRAAGRIGVAEPDLGRKDDSKKIRYLLLPSKALQEVVRVLEFGASRYGVDNWKHVRNGHTRYLNAMLRHVWAYVGGEENDPDSGLHHLAHAVCCGLFLIEGVLDK